MSFEYASRASKGARSYQEDAVALHAEPLEGTVALESEGHALTLTAVLADGMGGHAGGARASTLACTHFLDSVVQKTAGEIPAQLQHALDAANAAILQEVDSNPALNGMGCTLVGTTFTDRGIEWISVGDSPLFLLRGDELVVLNEDHSLAPEIDKLAETGRITWEAALSDPRRHFLRSALTGNEIELVDRSVRPLALAADDIVILASDGIHTLTHDDIHAVARANAKAGPVEIADALIEAVAERKQAYQDNTTLIVVLVR